MQSTEGRLGLELGLGLVRVRVRIRISDPRWIASSAHAPTMLPRDSGITFLAQRLAPRQITLISNIETSGEDMIRVPDLLNTDLELNIMYLYDLQK